MCSHLGALQHAADKETFHNPVSVPVVQLPEALPWDEEVAADGELCAQLTGIASTLCASRPSQPALDEIVCRQPS